jgi:hypothetical protein
MTYDVHFDQHVVIGDVPLSTPAWEVLNVHVLMSGPATRGQNLVMPGATGVRAIRHRNTEKTVSLELAIFGDTDPAGDPHADPEAGVWANWLALRNQFNALLLDEGQSTVLAQLHYRGGLVQGVVQVLGYELGDTYNPANLSATLDINLLAGMLL